MDFNRLRIELLSRYRDQITFSLDDEGKARWRQFNIYFRYLGSDDYCGRKFDYIESCWFEGDNNFVQVILSHADSPTGETWDCITIDMGYTLDELIADVEKEWKEGLKDV